MTQSRDAAKVQDALYRIAELAAAAHDLQEFYREVHAVVAELMYAESFFIALYDEERQLISWPYYVDPLDDDIPDPNQWDAVGVGNARGTTAYVLRTGEPQLITYERLTELAAQGEIELIGIMAEDSTWLGAPLQAEGKTVGVIVVHSYSAEHNHTEQDLDLLAFVGQHVGSALSRARAIEETRQRNAELALINSVQAAIAGELDQQAIYDLVGDKIQEVFDAQAVMIVILDETTGRHVVPYSIERGERQEWEPMLPGGFSGHVLETREPLLINEDVAGERARMGLEAMIVGDQPKSVLFVPLLAGGRATGVVSLQNVDREHAFTDADQRLLTTLAGSLSVALENARLVHETRQRNAELALINSVQQAIAGELDQQAIYDLVGDKIKEVFDAQAVLISMLDETSGTFVSPYLIERGERLEMEPRPPAGFTKHVLETREPLMVNEDVVGAAARMGVAMRITGEPPKSVLFVPLVTSGRVTGVISLQNVDREHAFTETDQRLLTTLAGSLSVALDNARLVHETRQRNAELALINSVQEAIAGELDQQAIYDLVGDKIKEVFDAQTVMIVTLDEASGLQHFQYIIERGQRLEQEPIPLGGFTKHVLETREPLLITEDLGAEFDRFHSTAVGGGEVPKSVLFVPLVTGGRATGAISLQNVDREHAFTDTDQRLLVTLAGTLSVALENARLVYETRQRNAELALINNVQAAIAGQLDPQAIYDLVGDKIKEVFDAQAVMISMLDETTGHVVVPYSIERGERLEWEPLPPGGFSGYVLETREPLLINEDVAGEATRRGIQRRTLGDPPKSALFVPLLAAGRATGVISLQNADREHAFSESDQRLLATLAGSLTVALENARLVDETRQRNAELALINSVQDALAGELELQAIYDVVGDKIQEVFDAQVVDICTYDGAADLVHFRYSIERGKRVSWDPYPLSRLGFMRIVIETGEPLLVMEDMAGTRQRLGILLVTEPEPKSSLTVPLAAGGAVSGLIALQNLDRERAFTESDQQLLETLARSLSVALDNARLVHETRQRVAELATINSVQGSIAGELDPQAIYDVVGEKLREVFDAQAVDIGVHDPDAGLIRFAYHIERGVHRTDVTMPVVGFRRHVLESREPLAILEDIGGAIVEYGNPVAVVGEESQGSAIFQPFVIGGRAAGVISVQNLDREHAFTPSDQQLLGTIAGSLGVALENAQLIHETRQRVAELGTVNSVGQALATQLDLDAIIHLVGERVRETFDADITYVALHDEAAGVIEFPYNWELGRYADEPPMPYGEGLTSRIIESGEPLLVDASAGDRPVIGTPSKSYLGVPIWAGDRTIGVLSVQSTEAQDRYGEADMRLLATLAANVGVAIQNARLFAEIERQREYFESLLEISPVAVIAMDADERVSSWNPAATALFGYTPEEAIGKPVDELVFGDESRDEGREVTREALATGRAQRITHRSRKDRTRVDVELMLVPLEVAGERLGFLGVYHDITELQHARQEAEAATQAKSAFLATMSHEIRTPMNAVIGMTGLLLATELTPEQREFAEVVRSSGDALLHVIDDILDYSKIEAGKLELEREPFDLRECVEGALDIIAPRAAEKSLELGALFAENLPAAVSGDVARLRQVLLNLLSNAVKFTDDGEVVVDVDAEPAPTGWHRLQLVVRDTGIGIPPDRMDRLFESFSQVDASTTRRYGGTGLGLAISKRLVELMGGRLWVESREGEGSSFHIELTAESADVPARPSFDGAQPQLAGKRLLVVDDNATNREIVSRQARSWGMEPVPVELPSRALALIEAGERFDVAVLDMVMPEMDGRELAREIRRHLGERELPLVLVTSLGRLPQARTADEFAAQLAKPLKASQLFDALMRVLAAQQPTEAARAASEGAAAASPLRILLAEDNAVNQQFALALLGKLGYQADVAANGVEALAALERQAYDVVLMDVQMPELDGLDTARRICARWPDADRPRIIAMTANALQEDRDACFAAGMDDYVAKPIRPEALAEALQRAQPLAAR